MVAIGPSDAAMAVTHVFAKANIGHDNQFRAARLDRSNRFLDNSSFGVGAGGPVVFLARNSKEQDSLQSEILGAFRLVGHFASRELENARHAADCLPLAELFAHEKRQNEIVDG